MWCVCRFHLPPLCTFNFLVQNTQDSTYPLCAHFMYPLCAHFIFLPPLCTFHFLVQNQQGSTHDVLLWFTCRAVEKNFTHHAVQLILYDARGTKLRITKPTKVADTLWGGCRPDEPPFGGVLSGGEGLHVHTPPKGYWTNCPLNLLLPLVQPQHCLVHNSMDHALMQGWCSNMHCSHTLVSFCAKKC